ncbi:hypothetical protein N7G274_007426 [Stereocaulon virgatum]|uniref:SET domain-containing protein n=1 Tax=Stereocaulon virgatum TaxID=373712 RepID=A0ABR4A4M9_9LECA
MDIDDVSKVGRWEQMLQRQKATLQAASKRKGERPKDRKSRAQLVDEFMVRYAATKMRRNSFEDLIHSSFIAPPYQPCIASFTELKRIFIKDLRLETHHRGFYALLKVVTPPTTMTAVMAVVGDEIGDGVRLQLYHQKDDEYRKGEEVVQVNKACIIKEPYFKVMGDGDYGLRVDHVSDIIWLPSDDDRLPLAWQPRITELEKDAEALENEGNGALKVGRLHQAIEIYTQALRYSKTGDQSRMIKLNRSLANLKLGNYDQGLEDVGELTAAYQKSEKGFYRAARCLYELTRFQECHDVLKLLLEQYPHCSEAKKEIARTKIRLTEQQHAVFDFKAMHETAKINPPQLDCATYVGPVAIKASDGRGRGLFTTENVVAGELLLCEKAFAYCWADAWESQTSSKTRLLMNCYTNRAVIGTQADMITDIVQNMYHNPSLMPSFTSLHHGDHKPVKKTIVDGVPIVDTFLVDRVISLNVFGCPRSSLESHFQKAEQQEKDRGYRTCGLFIKASYINHSCASNSRRSFIGDMQIVRASRNLPAGTEVNFWYHAPDDTITYEQMQNKLESWRFRCICKICEHMKNTKKNVRVKRAALLQDLAVALNNPDSADLPKAERLLATMQKTYTAPATEVPRFALRDPYLVLTRLYNSQKQHDKAIQTAWKFLDSLGFVVKRQDPSWLKSAFEVEQWGLMTDSVVEIWVHLWTAYAHLAPDLCKKAEEIAKISYKICVGEAETFDQKYGKIAHQAISEGLHLGLAFQKLRV